MLSMVYSTSHAWKKYLEASSLEAKQLTSPGDDLGRGGREAHGGTGIHSKRLPLCQGVRISTLHLHVSIGGIDSVLVGGDGQGGLVIGVAATEGGIDTASSVENALKRGVDKRRNDGIRNLDRGDRVRYEEK